MKKNNLIMVGSLFTIILIVTAYSLSGEVFQGKLIGVKRINAPTIQPIKLSNLLNTDLKYLNFQKSWLPKELRPPSDKTLQKVYPFPSVPIINSKNIIASDSIGKLKLSTWQHAGVQGIGVITSIDYFNKDYKFLLLGTETSGLYKSENFGDNWKKLDNFPSNKIERVAINPNDKNHLLVLANAGVLYESKDAGNKWTILHTFSIDHYPRLTISWHQKNIFVNYGIESLYSSDNGFSWNEIDMPGSNYLFTKSHTFDTRITPNGYGLYMGDENNKAILYKTNDYGKSWSKIREIGNTLDSYDLAYDITDNGNRIILCYYLYNQSANQYLNKIIYSNDGGANWLEYEPTLINFSGFSFIIPQALNIDRNVTDNFYVFSYMKGIIACNLGTKKCEYDTNTNNDVLSVLESENSQNALQILPLDLRFGEMKTIYTAAAKKLTPVNPYLYNAVISPYLDLNVANSVKPTNNFTTQEYEASSDKNVILNSDQLEQIAPINNLQDNAISKINVQQKNIFLLPTDQGIYYYDNETKTLKSISKGLYIGDTGSVSITSCPRVYSGLWHAGYTYINNDGKIYGNPLGEIFSITAGQDSGCSTPVLADGIMYFDNGTTADTTKNQWLMNNINFRRIYYKRFQYDNEWFYGIASQYGSSKESLIKINFSKLQWNVIALDPQIETNTIQGFYLENNNGQKTIWLLDNSLKLWKTTNEKDWILSKDLKTIKDFKVIINYNFDRNTNLVGNDLYEWRGTRVFVDKNLIAIGGHGLYLSNDGGNTWQTHFPYALVSNVVKDTQGRLFVGLYPVYRQDLPIANNETTGVWFSEDNGSTWKKFKNGAEKTWVSGLTIDKINKTLYAATRGESLLVTKL